MRKTEAPRFIANRNISDPRLSGQRDAQTEAGMRMRLTFVAPIKPPLFIGMSLLLLLSPKRTGGLPFLLSFLLVLLKSVLFLKFQMWLMKEALVEITTAVTVCLGMPIISSYRRRHGQSHIMMCVCLFKLFSPTPPCRCPQIHHQLNSGSHLPAPTEVPIF